MGVKQLSNIDAAYLAGFIDGDCYKWNDYISVYCVLTPVSAVSTLHGVA